jgi:ribosomal protein L44E
VIIETHKVSRRDEDYDEITDETVYNTYEAKQVKFTGRHWLSNATIIASLSDQQLKSALEYHKGMISQLEFELTARKIHRNKEEYGYPTRPKAGKDKVVTSTETRTTKTVRVKKIKEEADPMDALMKLAQSGKLDLKKMAEMLQQKIAAKNLGVPPTGTETK